jgi:hypothetical protein
MTENSWIKDGIFGFGRFSVGWNLHSSRQVKTLVLGVAVSFVSDRFLVALGPLTFIWLYERRTT